MKLGTILDRHRVGTWLVLNPKMTRVLGSGRTPQAAMRRAGLPTTLVPASEDPGYGKRPVMMQVPPNTPYY